MTHKPHAHPRRQRAAAAPAAPDSGIGRWNGFGSACRQWSIAGRVKRTLMRHDVVGARDQRRRAGHPLTHPPAPRARCMQHPSATTALVDPRRLLLRSPARCPRAGNATVLLTPITTTAKQHLFATAGTHDQPTWGHLHRARAPWRNPQGRLPHHYCCWTKPDRGATLPTRPPQRHGARDGAAPGRQAQRSRAVLLTTQRHGCFTTASADLPAQTSAAPAQLSSMPKQRTPRLRAKINRRRVSSNQRKKAEAPLLPGKGETAVSTPEKRGFESPFTGWNRRAIPPHCALPCTPKTAHSAPSN